MTHIPAFGSDWTNRMNDFIENTTVLMDDTETDVWLLEHCTKICKSWKSTDKSKRLRGFFFKLVKDSSILHLIFDSIDNWAGNFELPSSPLEMIILTSKGVRRKSYTASQLIDALDRYSRQTNVSIAAVYDITNIDDAELLRRYVLYCC